MKKVNPKIGQTYEIDIAGRVSTLLVLVLGEEDQEGKHRLVDLETGELWHMMCMEDHYKKELSWITWTRIT